MATLKKRMALEQEDVSEEQRNPSDNIGSSQFSDIVNSEFFVDKTLLIKDFVKSNYKCLLITAPHHFGKSINTSMLKDFLRLRVNEYGETIDIPSVREMFRTKKIFKDQNFVNNHLGKHPVVYVNLKCSDAVVDYEDILNVLRRALHESYCEHKYLLQNNRLEEDDRRILTEYCSPRMFTEISRMMIRNGLKFLSQLLYRQFDRKVYVLIDEYDSIVNRAISSKYLNLRQTTGILSEMLFNVLKNNDDCLKKGFLTGVSHLAGGVHTWLSTIERFTFLNSSFAKYFGITNQEMDRLLNKFKTAEENRKKIKEWYNGYEVPYTGTHIFNIWSVVNYLEKKKLQSYGHKSNSIQNLDDLLILPAIRFPIEELIMGHSANLKCIEVVEMYRTVILKEIMTNTAEIKSSHVEMFLAFLLERGYLTSLGTAVDKVKIPNKEIEAEFTYKLERYYENLCGKAKFNDTIDAINAITSTADKAIFNNISDTLTTLCDRLLSSRNETFTEISFFCLLYIISCNTKFECIKMHVLTEDPNDKNIHLVLMDEAQELVVILNLKLRSDAKKAYEEMGTKMIAKFFFQSYFGRKNKDTIRIGLNVSESTVFSMAYCVNNGEVVYTGVR